MDLKPSDGIKTEYESVRRNCKRASDKPYNNTWNFKQTLTRKRRHPCEKPEHLISHIIDVSSNEGDLVVDAFCGSCDVPKCCEKMNRRCIAGAVDDTYFKTME
jgi:adenine-specific DNA-methyltransferase